MVWFGRLRRRGGEVTVEAEDGPARTSVWERLKDDAGARALRAGWEARWDEF